MNGGESLETCLDQVREHLHSFDLVMDRAIKLAPDYIASAFHYQSDVPLGAVCLGDCMLTLGGVRYALDRYCEVGAEHRQVNDSAGAAFFERYYLDDVVVRLYSAAEQLADAVIATMEATDADFAAIRGTSQWERVRKYLNQKQPQSPITAAFGAVRRSKSWRFAMSYRGRWSHQKPPTIAGLGLVYERRKRWVVSDDGTSRRLVVGGGDAPQHTIRELASIFVTALVDFLDVVLVVLDEYYRVLAEAGIRETPAGLTMRIGLHSD